MIETIQGDLDARGLRVGIVLPRFNEAFGNRLLSGALDGLLRHGAAEEDIVVTRVPGCFEIPAAVAAIIERLRPDAVIGLGVLIRGATSHFDHIAAEVSRGLGACGRESRVPVIYGVVTAENQEQAMERCGGKAGNRGWDAALAAVEMARLLKAMGGKRQEKKAGS